MEWISVNDRLPNDGDLVLIYYNCVFVVARYLKGEGFTDYGGYSMFHPTHWMTLPDSPKKGLETI